MIQALSLAKQQFLAPSDLDDGRLSQVLDGLMQSGADAADLYFQYSRVERWSLEEGIVKSGSHQVDQGVGVRVVSGERQALAYSEEIHLAALTDAAMAARAISRSGEQRTVQAWRDAPGKSLYPSIAPVDSLPTPEKLALMRRADATARAADPRVQQVMVSLMASDETVLIAAADGTLAADVRPLIRMDVTVIVESAGRREQAAKI